jgi:hypothetical protein
VPIDISAEVDPAIAEELNLMLTELFSLLYRGLSPLWKVPGYELLQPLAILRGARKIKSLCRVFLEVSFE